MKSTVDSTGPAASLAGTGQARPFFRARSANASTTVWPGLHAPALSEKAAVLLEWDATAPAKLLLDFSLGLARPDRTAIRR